jgi:hypothetical protein
MGNVVRSPESASMHFRLIYFIIDARQARELMHKWTIFGGTVLPVRCRSRRMRMKSASGAEFVRIYLPEEYPDLFLL